MDPLSLYRPDVNIKNHAGFTAADLAGNYRFSASFVRYYLTQYLTNTMYIPSSFFSLLNVYHLTATSGHQEMAALLKRAHEFKPVVETVYVG